METSLEKTFLEGETQVNLMHNLASSGIEWVSTGCVLEEERQPHEGTRTLLCSSWERSWEGRGTGVGGWYILEVGTSSGLQGEMMKPKGNDSKQISEFILVFVSSKWSLIRSVPSRLLAEPASGRILQAASSLPAILRPGHSPASPRNPCVQLFSG